MHEVFNQEQWTLYQRGMRALAGTAAGEVARRTPVPQRAQDMLDIGGAHGYYSVAICRRHRGLRSVILDLPEAIEEAQHILEKEQMGGRVVHQSGNVLTDDLGTEAWDVIFMGQPDSPLRRTYQPGAVSANCAGLTTGWSVCCAGIYA